ncbi:hypothetical protein H5410_005110 [Solanum commersonii]|uniref:Reverse transcriptase domain-containing protein n=1 Tax=Solanum commersonii TaxID=4109 RepID=A0A9J6A6P6_SOLCO|nr:hypothetical protein H5410_005110 [Solanum commersonii]
MVVTIVYAKCDRNQRLELWEEISHIAKGQDHPWIVGGDFNMVLNKKEEIGGLLVMGYEVQDFLNCIESNELYHVQFKGSAFTWWNGRLGTDCISERLDKILGFCERVVDLILRLLANNYYYVLLNGQSHGFFHSTGGVKQGDPLSLALFIISVEVLSRALNVLFEDPHYVGYGMPKWSANLNHLAFANNLIYFLLLMPIIWRKFY